ncbi:MAG: alkyl hydroperoxide reductase subunit F [Deltaproteobacteria bacterium]|nr:alkyl hydroperoxide reductase subunit F [Deltaproteobacteria bacterium]
MLDDALLEQLRTHFSSLAAEYTFALFPSAHDKQAELRGLLEGLASASPKLHLVEQGPEQPVVQFDLLRGGAATGVRFRGVPGGHEFTSLVLAVLNADGKGKLPDEGIARRVKALKGPIDLRTYVSLSCTNCPDVVQALNVMALLHGDLRHTMIDGGLVEEEVERLGIQAVPTVYAGDKLLHVGRGSLAELLDRLEEHFGSAPAPVGEAGAAAVPAARHFDVVIVGGGPAGCSAAIYTARKGLSTAMVTQTVGGQVRETLGIENLVSVKYTEGKRLAADLEQHLRAYPVELLEHRKVLEILDGERKEVRLAGGEVLTADALILATGARWRELGVPGEKEHLGRGVAFCPHCDGPFYKGRRVAVVGGGNSGVEAAIDLAGICSHVTLVEFLEALKADAVLVKKLKTLPNVAVILNARTTEVVGNGDGVTALRYSDRHTNEAGEVALDGVFVQIGLVPNSQLVKELLETNRHGEIVVDARGRTSVAGIYAAGDVTTVPFKQIVIAMGEGAKAALTAFEDRMRAG